MLWVKARLACCALSFWLVLVDLQTREANHHNLHMICCGYTATLDKSTAARALPLGNPQLLLFHPLTMRHLSSSGFSKIAPKTGTVCCKIG